MIIHKLTKEQILANPVREYNPHEWTKTVERYAKYDDVQFYIEPKETSVWDYDRFYAVYTTPEGIRLFNQISYSSCLSNNGFCRVVIDVNGIVTTHEFKNGEKTGRLENCKHNRQIMAKHSKYLDAIYSNCI
jgi:hypothetical protein